MTHTYKQAFNDQRENMRQSNICVIGIPEEEGDWGSIENVSEGMWPNVS